MQPFTFLKFRTMVVDADDAPHRAYVESIMDTRAPPASSIYKFDRTDEVTKVGAQVRRSSLDELPQLFNVLRGSMSLVGPRPCIAYETAHVRAAPLRPLSRPRGHDWPLAGVRRARTRPSVRPSISTPPYARNWSLALDLRLLARTPIAVLRGRRATS